MRAGISSDGLQRVMVIPQGSKNNKKKAVTPIVELWVMRMVQQFDAMGVRK